MTKSNSKISTKTYDPRRSTNVWNFITTSTGMTRRMNQQGQNTAECNSFRFFSFIFKTPFLIVNGLG